MVNGDIRTDLYEGDGQKSAGQLVKEVTEDLSTLVRKEIELAKQELGEAVGAKVKGGVLVAIAAFLGFFALIFAVLAIRDALLGTFAAWIADLVTAAILVVVGALGVLLAKRKLSTPISAEMTKQTIKEDVQWAKTLGKR